MVRVKDRRLVFPGFGQHAQSKTKVMSYNSLMASLSAVLPDPWGHLAIGTMRMWMASNNLTLRAIGCQVRVSEDSQILFSWVDNL